MADTGVSIASIQSLELELPPSCIEFCPNHPSYFLVGTYNLQRDDVSSVKHEGNSDDDSEDGATSTNEVKKAQNRNGSIVVFRLLDRKM